MLRKLKKILKELIIIIEKDDDVTILELHEILRKYGITLEDLKKFAGVK